ncbi:MAG: hypothetical protein ACK559_40705, partial [bacterium]
ALEREPEAEGIGGRHRARGDLDALGRVGRERAALRGIRERRSRLAPDPLGDHRPRHRGVRGEVRRHAAGLRHGRGHGRGRLSLARLPQPVGERHPHRAADAAEERGFERRHRPAERREVAAPACGGVGEAREGVV